MATRKIKISDKDLGWSAFMANIDAIVGVKMNVGVLGKSTNVGKQGPTQAEIATWNEYGTATIPARPFMRSSFDKNLSKYNKLIASRIGKPHLLGLLGEVIKGDIQQRIVALKTPPNAPSTVLMKGSSNPLIDTGRMRQSIDFEIKARNE